MRSARIGVVLAPMLVLALAGCLGDGCWMDPDKLFVREATDHDGPRSAWANLSLSQEFPAVGDLLRTPHPANTLYGFGGGGVRDLAPDQARALRDGLAQAWSQLSNATLPGTVPLWFEHRAYTLEVQPPQQVCT